LFLLLRWQSFYQCAHQQRLVVYSIPGHQAIDLFAGRAVLSLRDTVFSTQGSAPDFYTGATRIAYRAKAVLVSDQREFTWKGRHLLVLDRTYLFRDKAPLPILDLLVVSGGTRNRAAEVLPYLRPKQVVTDGSLPPWKTALWKAQCDSLRIPFYDVKQQGGFVMNL
jgi:competence protein ComEC